jgi:hypothetical protein
MARTEPWLRSYSVQHSLTARSRFRAIGRNSGTAPNAGHAIRRILLSASARCVKGIRELPNDTVIDGEIAALEENGRPSFNLLQGFGSSQAVVLYGFDLLHGRAQTNGVR